MGILLPIGARLARMLGPTTFRPTPCRIILMMRRRLSAEQLEARDLPATAFALGTGAFANNLYRFDTASPATVSAAIPVTGLTTFTLGGIDFRPANGSLYGVGFDLAAGNVQVYTIDPNTGAATAVGGPAAVTGLTGATAFGVDFNPVPDRIRVVTDRASDGAGGNTNNFRLNPDSGALVAIDPDLDFTAVPGGAPEVAVAYTNPDTDTGTGTQLFGIVSGSDQLVTNGGAAPGFNVLTPVGALGPNTSANAGLDIFGPGNQAVSILEIGGTNGLYTVNLTTGANTFVGNVGDGTLDLSDVAVAPAAAPVVVGGSLDGSVTPLAPAPFGATPGQVTAGTAVNVFGNSANVRATTGDVNGDGSPDIIAVTGPGTPIRVAVVSGADNKTVLVAPFDPFGGDFTGGGFVSAGDFDAGSGTPDGRAEFVVSPDQGGGPRVTVFRLASGATTAEVRANFFGIDDPNFRGGARTAVGDINNDGRLDLVAAAGFLGGPRVAVFDGTTVLSGTPTRLVGDFFAFPGADAQTLRNGAFVAAGDVDGDGNDDLIFGGGPGGAPRVFILSGALVAAGTIDAAYNAPISSFFVANNSTSRAGVRVGVADLDGDARADVVVGSGEGVDGQVRLYRGANFTGTTEPTTFQDVDVFGTGTLANGVFVG
jgi:hypothetical protein